MLRISISACGIALSALAALAQPGVIWRNPLPGAQDLRTLDFEDGLGVAGGAGGTILRTEDGGTNWSFAANPSIAAIRDIDLADSRTGFAGCDSGILLKSTDAGKTWNPILNLGGRPMMALHFLDKDTGFVVADAGLILSTRDGGSTWERDTLQFGSYYGIGFLDAKVGYVGGIQVHGLLYRTGDGGRTWQKIPYDGYAIKSIHSGFAVGEYGTAMNLAGGQAPDLLGGDLLSIHILDRKWGIAVTGTSLRLSRDGGVTWTSRDSYSRQYLADARIVDSSRAVAVGSGGLLLRSSDGGKTWDSLPDIARQDIHRLQTFGKDTAFALTLGVAAGSRKRTLDGWKTWEPIAESVAASAQRMYFRTSRLGFLIGDSLSFTLDAGNTWTTLPWNRPGQATRNPEGFLFLNDSVGFLGDAAGSPHRSRILKTRDRGATWELKSEWDSDYGGQHFQFPGGRVGYAQGGSLFKTTDSGETWKPLPNPPGLGGWIHFPDERVGFAPDYTKLYKTADGGLNWAKVLQAGASENISSVWFRDSLTGFVATENSWPDYWGRILRTVDGGATWKLCHSGRTAPLYHIEGTADGRVFAAGAGGTILELEDPASGLFRPIPHREARRRGAPGAILNPGLGARDALGRARPPIPFR